MALFGWIRKQVIPEPIYSVMNDDHVHLYQLLGEIRQAVGTQTNRETDAERSSRRKLLVGLIERLIREAREHFLREEALMDLYGFPEKLDHRAHHGMMLQQIQTFHSQLASGRMPLTQDVSVYIKEWLTGHIRSYDRDLERFLFETAKQRNKAEVFNGDAEGMARLDSMVARMKQERRTPFYPPHH